MLYCASTLIVFALLATAGLSERQAPSFAPASSVPSGYTVQVYTTPVYPGGVTDVSQFLVTTYPLPCLDGCFSVISYYT